MPIAFPPAVRGHPRIQAKGLIQKPFDYVPAPNMGNPNYRFNVSTLKGGMGKVFPRANPRSPGVNFAKAFSLYNVETRPQHLTDPRLWLEDEGTLNMSLTYVSRDSTGAPLAGCTIMVFRTQDRSFVGETVSDGSGNWTLPMLKGGPFFTVEYLAGSPDRAGTSVNTLTPVKV